MRAKDKTASKTHTIPDAQGVVVPEGSSGNAVSGLGVSASGGVFALGVQADGWSGNLRGPCLSSAIAGYGETRTANSDVSHADAGARGHGQEQASAAGVGSSEGNRSCGRRSKGVGGLRSSDEAGERGGPRTRSSEGGPCASELPGGNATSPSRLFIASTQLWEVAERARREPTGKFHSLAHLIDEDVLHRAYHRLRPEAAVGIDGVTKEMYGRELEANLRDLYQRLKTGRYRHQPIRRTYIPKANGQTRPLGVSSLEDKVVQGAIREVLEVVYEQDFRDCSYGFRPGRGAHQAIRTLNRLAYTGQVRWVLEADIQSFFDSVDHDTLVDLIRQRVPDGSLLRLIGKGLKAGILDGQELSEPGLGTPQGSILSPLLANIYLHHVLDVWFEQEAKPRLRGKAQLVRYADDFVMCFERRDDAERVLAVLSKRMERFGLKLHPEKTRLVCFERPARGQQQGKGPDSFDFLGFTIHWRRSIKGHWVPAFKTSGKRLRKAMDAITDYCRGQRHLSVTEQHAGLVRRLIGWFNYFGVNGNCRSLQQVRHHTARVWHKWLTRRSQRSRLNWERFQDLLKAYPLPPARVYASLW